jgi:hypothetical protein
MSESIRPECIDLVVVAMGSGGAVEQRERPTNGHRSSFGRSGGRPLAVGAPGLGGDGARVPFPAPPPERGAVGGLSSGAPRCRSYLLPQVVHGRKAFLCRRWLRRRRRGGRTTASLLDLALLILLRAALGRAAPGSLEATATGLPQHLSLLLVPAGVGGTPSPSSSRIAGATRATMRLADILQAGDDGAARGRSGRRAAKSLRGDAKQDRDFEVRAAGQFIQGYHSHFLLRFSQVDVVKPESGATPPGTRYGPQRSGGACSARPSSGVCHPVSEKVVP